MKMNKKRHFSSSTWRDEQTQKPNALYLLIYLIYYDTLLGLSAWTRWAREIGVANVSLFRGANTNRRHLLKVLTVSQLVRTSSVNFQISCVHSLWKQTTYFIPLRDKAPASVYLAVRFKVIPLWLCHFVPTLAAIIVQGIGNCMWKERETRSDGLCVRCHVLASARKNKNKVDTD